MTESLEVCYSHAIIVPLVFEILQCTSYRLITQDYTGSFTSDEYENEQHILCSHVDLFLSACKRFNLLQGKTLLAKCPDTSEK